MKIKCKSFPKVIELINGDLTLGFKKININRLRSGRIHNFSLNITYTNKLYARDARTYLRKNGGSHE